jgi:hypothetical protein
MLNFRKTLTFLFALELVACGTESSSDDTSDDTGTTEPTSDSMTGASMTGASMTGASMSTTTADTETDPTVDPDTTAGPEVMCYGIGGPGAEGDACAANDECASGVCTIYTDVPLNEDAVCAAMPSMTEAGCNTRVTGTIFDFSTLAPVEGATLKVAAALNAITNPAGADAIASATSDAMGRVDVTTEVPISAAIAIIALVEGPGGFLTATGLASPADGSSYAVGTGIHDLWIVPSASIDAWSTALEADAEVAPEQLPLGEAGGIVGLVRDAAGLPIAGATVEPADAGSGVVIRYIAADNTVVADATTETGIFVVLGAAQTGEDFNAIVDGNVAATGTAGSANGAVFTVIMNAGG